MATEDAPLGQVRCAGVSRSWRPPLQEVRTPSTRFSSLRPATQVKGFWLAAVGGTTSIFGAGIMVGTNLLIPAWAWFHCFGAIASGLKRQSFEVFMHCAMLAGIGSFALGYWGQSKEDTSKSSWGF